MTMKYLLTCAQSEDNGFVLSEQESYILQCQIYVEQLFKLARVDNDVDQDASYC